MASDSATKSRGRPIHSDVRDRISKLLLEGGPTYGYDIYRKYNKQYKKVALRSIYYNLEKGIELGVFTVKEVQQHKGNYSWGESAKRVIFDLAVRNKP